MSSATVNLIPAFDDNYFFCVSQNSDALIVDPGSAIEVLKYLAEHQLNLKIILLTHHHGDHIGGVKELAEKTGAQILGPAGLEEYGLKCDRICREGDIIRFADLQFTTIEVPGHTRDHLAYFCIDKEWLFCGDTLFSLGCGRLFEGTFEQMHASLNRLKALPDSTQVFCAHEYTLNNLKFTLQYLIAEKASEKMLHMYANLQQKIIFLRAQNKPTIPSTIGFEKQFNLFLKAKTVDEFKKVREARNAF